MDALLLSDCSHTIEQQQLLQCNRNDFEARAHQPDDASVLAKI
jgi:hypothetical protein